MAKYSYKFKLKVVQEYLSGEGGLKFLCRKHDIPTIKNLQKWVSTYNKFGADGLLRKRIRKSYSFDFKLYVVELYLTTEISCQALALQVGIKDSSTVSRWVNDYRRAGPDALKDKRKGCPSQVKKPKDNTSINNNQSNLNTEYLKQLEEENLKLRIENAYLKELRRLRSKEIHQNKKRELYIASEENSN
ncbi:transposase [Vallitalea guaymasensis]|uniref:transposase n=1 Tax=Vallitalea guaymasensis TaxID=1185412 RepID=UPI00272990C6|nr:transposase [Vallitalea guaymasensis]